MAYHFKIKKWILSAMIMKYLLWEQKSIPCSRSDWSNWTNKMTSHTFCHCYINWQGCQNKISYFGDLNNINILSHDSGGSKSEIKLQAELVPSMSVLDLWMVVFSLCPHRVFPYTRLCPDHLFFYRYQLYWIEGQPNGFIVALAQPPLKDCLQI